MLMPLSQPMLRRSYKGRHIYHFHIDIDYYADILIIPLPKAAIMIIDTEVTSFSQLPHIEGRHADKV